MVSLIWNAMIMLSSIFPTSRVYSIRLCNKKISLFETFAEIEYKYRQNCVSIDKLSYVDSSFKNKYNKKMISDLIYILVSTRRSAKFRLMKGYTKNSKDVYLIFINNMPVLCKSTINNKCYYICILTNPFVKIEFKRIINETQLDISTYKKKLYYRFRKHKRLQKFNYNNIKNHRWYLNLKSAATYKEEEICRELDLILKNKN